MFGWWTASLLYYLAGRMRLVDLSVTFVLNVLRSIPQIVGVLLGYILLTLFIENDILRSPISQLVWMSFVISIFLFLEIVDLIGERVRYYEKLDFFQAMLCCGIKESRIINHEILWKNSRAHLLHKVVALFGSALFLQCSIDFTVSVGLSTDVSLSNFPVTLGNMLASIDSKQDILAVGAALWHPADLPSLPFRHLQGISVAFLIVFSLLCMYKISNGIVQRYRL
jgi:ABC-type dipeptide/oligopeptide/nickel transport system permease subunit